MEAALYLNRRKSLEAAAAAAAAGRGGEELLGGSHLVTRLTRLRADLEAEHAT